MPQHPMTPAAKRVLHCAATAITLLIGSSLIGPMTLQAEDAWPMHLRDGQGGPVAGEPQLRDPQINQQTRLWASEADIAPGKVSDGRGREGREDMQQPGSGGYASPIVAAGKIFHWHYRPSGTVYDIPRAESLGMSQEQLRAQAQPPQGNLVYGHERWLVSATDSLTAIDAQTGRTAWQTELTDQGLNWIFFNKGGGGMTPVYHDGMVVAMTTSAQVFGVDAENGEVRWSYDLMPRHLQNMAYRQEAMQGRGMAPRFNRDFLVSLVAADGIVVVNDQRLHRVQNSAGTTHHYDVYNSYIGLNVHTGEKVWEAEGVGDMRSSPLLWRHQGKTYVVATNRFHLTLLDISNGQQMWQSELGHEANFGLGLNDHYLVMNARQEDRGIKHLTGYRIDLHGLHELWSWGDVRPESNIILLNDHGYMLIDGTIRCFDLASGATLSAMDNGGRVSLETANPFLAYYGGWFFTSGGEDGSGYTLFHHDPQHMEASRRSFNLDVSRGYGGLIFPAFANGTMFFRTEDSHKIVAHRLR